MLSKLGAAGGSSNTMASNTASTWASKLASNIGFQLGFKGLHRSLATIRLQDEQQAAAVYCF
jgi:hypothetical protein